MYVVYFLLKLLFCFTLLSKAYATQSTLSPEVTSKAASNDEDINESIKILTDKLSAALLNIRSKEDLVKQHAKVAEEAVSGINYSHFSVLLYSCK